MVYIIPRLVDRPHADTVPGGVTCHVSGMEMLSGLVFYPSPPILRPWICTFLGRPYTAVKSPLAPPPTPVDFAAARIVADAPLSVSRTESFLVNIDHQSAKPDYGAVAAVSYVVPRSAIFDLRRRRLMPASSPPSAIDAGVVAAVVDHRWPFLAF